jgi:D-serine deaminase-like pyridoxal phosphate-dependent protein
VPCASYIPQLQQRIDVATVTGNCAALRALLDAAKTTSEAHEKATGFPNDALVSYIQAGQARAGCPS